MMQPRLILDPSVQEFEGLDAIPFLIDDVHVAPERADLEAHKAEVVERVRTAYTLETLKDVPELRAYRDFFWRVGIDPTKTRPAAEALIRRILGGKPLPKINTLVDAYNLASIETRIALAAFDAATLHGDLVMRMARAGEEFLGIGMEKSVVLTGHEVVNVDDAGLIAIYPYRDSARTAVTPTTRATVFLVCGVPGIPRETLLDAEAVTRDLVLRFCGPSERASATAATSPLR
ncbi:MAG TPA: phenylalanine--tRNA ligase beta subunit-related protein [Thermoplasmata archaeon]|nr:phenylalanine--tRNA ligase beta subunit-related protein [Thermoplasmata archaeon]